MAISTACEAEVVGTSPIWVITFLPNFLCLNVLLSDHLCYSYMPKGGGNSTSPLDAKNFESSPLEAEAKKKQDGNRAMRGRYVFRHFLGNLPEKTRFKLN